MSMNNTANIIIAGLFGSIATLLVVDMTQHFFPRRVVHVVEPQPEPAATEEEKTKDRDDAAAAKIAMRAKQREITQRCNEMRGQLIVTGAEGVVGCVLAIGTAPLAEWLGASKE